MCLQSRWGGSNIQCSNVPQVWSRWKCPIPLICTLVLARGGLLGHLASELWQSGGELVSQESLTDTLNEWYEKPESQPAAQASCSSIKKNKKNNHASDDGWNRDSNIDQYAEPYSSLE